METILLAGGRGSRIAEESASRPKPMVEIGGRPMLWHIMNIYSHYGHSDFLIACGYKSQVIKQYFHEFITHNSDYVIDLKTGRLDYVTPHGYDWRVAVIDTGLDTMTGGRIRRLRGLVKGPTFMATYGDGVGNIDIGALVAFHRAHGKLATVTAVRPPSRFGGLIVDGGQVKEFSEKPQTGEGWINGGFFVFERPVFDYLDDDATVLEREPLEALAKEGQLMAFQHPGFWQPMDTVRERDLLESLWQSGQAPWKVWP
ncbi:MAG: glucose-1-phosphate cytidylyltransferase [Gemmatimonadales bacterium]